MGQVADKQLSNGARSSYQILPDPVYSELEGFPKSSLNLLSQFVSLKCFRRFGLRKPDRGQHKEIFPENPSFGFSKFPITRPAGTIRVGKQAKCKPLSITDPVDYY